MTFHEYKRSTSSIGSRPEWVEANWAWLLLVPMLVFTAGPFLAPVAMKLGWTEVGRAIYTLYLPFCHQLPQRSWFFFGDKLTYTLAEINRVYPSTDPWQLRYFYGTPEMGWRVAWSDRMISFYFLTPVFAISYFVLRRFGIALRPISAKVWLLALTPILLDGLTHAASDILSGISNGGFRDTNVWLAFITANRFPGFYAGDQFGTFNWWMRLVSGALAAWATAYFVFTWLDQTIHGSDDLETGAILSAEASENDIT